MKRFLIIIPMLLLSFVVQAAQQLIPPTLGYLGFAMDNVPTVVKAHFPNEVAEAEGVIVTYLADISPAADDGIKLYDILLAYDDQPITRVEDLIIKISNDTVGRKINIKVLRQSKIITVAVTMGQRPWASVEQLEMQQYQPLTNTRKVSDKPKTTPKQEVNTAQVPLNIAGKPMFPMRKKRKTEAWGDERHIWPDFYTDSTNDMWNDMINAPFKMGRMPGGWRAPFLSTPDPVTIGDAVTNQIPPIMEEAGNMTDFSD